MEEVDAFNSAGKKKYKHTINLYCDQTALDRAEVEARAKELAD